MNIWELRFLLKNLKFHNFKTFWIFEISVKVLKNLKTQNDFKTFDLLGFWLKYQKSKILKHFRILNCSVLHGPTINIIHFNRPMTIADVALNPIEFGPIQPALLNIQQNFHVDLSTPDTGYHCIITPPTDKIGTRR